MPKQTQTSNTPEIILDHHAATPLYRQLYERLQAAILTGQLEMGMRLPSTRVLASTLGVSRNTTALAYELLLMEGYIESKVGDGTRVTRLQMTEMSLPEQNGQEQDITDHSKTTLAVFSQRTQALINMPDSEEPPDDLVAASPFNIGQPDVTSFPYEIWARLVARNARQLLQTVSLYQNAQGYAPLRKAIAAHIGITRGIHCSPEQIILTAGTQGALDLAARVLLDPGASVWVEDPGYPGARGVLLSAGAKLVAVPLDEEGIDIAYGRKLCREARLAIVTPSHQFPTGGTMSLRRRLELLEWSRETSAWIIEDDYDSEYRFSGRPLEALRGLDRTGRVLYVGTFSKVLFPALRLGYLVVPSALLEGFLATRRLIDKHPPLLEQMALADFLAEGHFARHLRKMLQYYTERRKALIDALRQEMSDILDITVPEAGIHLAAWLPSNRNTREIAQQAAMCGLYIQPISRFSLQPLQRDGLLFGFACASPEELRAGVHRLALALKEHQRKEQLPSR